MYNDFFSTKYAVLNKTYLITPSIFVCGILMDAVNIEVNRQAKLGHYVLQKALVIEVGEASTPNAKIPST